MPIFPPMKEYRDIPTEFHKPSEAELKARSRRNIAIAIALAVFMIFVFVTIVSKGTVT